MEAGQLMATVWRVLEPPRTIIHPLVGKKPNRRRINSGRMVLAFIDLVVWDRDVVVVRLDDPLLAGTLSAGRICRKIASLHIAELFADAARAVRRCAIAACTYHRPSSVTSRWSSVACPSVMLD